MRLYKGVALVALTFGTAFAEPPRLSAGKVSSEEIAKLVAGLGDASYDTRTVAYRQLCVIGIDAREALEQVAKGSDAEASIRATQLLSTFDQMLFAGCEVSLGFSKQDIAWSEPVDLRISITNHSRYTARIPLDLPGASSPTLDGDARQVADMLDVSEYLRVRAAEGRELELRMDDAGGDALVMQAVQARLDDHAGSRLSAGESVQMTIRNFNRGWARYPALDAGEYAVVLDYTPEWDDSGLISARAGRVVSNVARLHVKEGAPSKVSRSGSQAEILVEQTADAFIAKVENQTDQPIVVNGNFGGMPPFADGRWTIESEGHRTDVGVPSKPNATWNDFEATKLLEVAPGASVELTRIPVARIRRAAKEVATPGGAAGWTLHFAYSNLCDRNWQVRQGEAFAKDAQVPAVLREPLSRRLLNTRLTSPHLALPAGD